MIIKKKGKHFNPIENVWKICHSKLKLFIILLNCTQSENSKLSSERKVPKYRYEHTNYNIIQGCWTKCFFGMLNKKPKWILSIKKQEMYNVWLNLWKTKF